jgi:protocatechuate 3,4-dioxygenase beta subunit
MTDLNRRSAAIGLALASAVGVGAACSRSAVAEAAQTPARPRADLYNCDGCQAVAEREASTLPSSLVLARSDEPGQRLRLSGRVLAVDGVTPVGGVVIYAHHTNAEGLYANGSSETLWSRRHGRLRGWVKSDADGRYAFETVKPAPYPDMTMPAHIHVFIQEPGRQPYYIDDVVFAGEFKVDAAYRAAQELRGGTGIVSLSLGPDGALQAVRDIRLETHPA